MLEILIRSIDGSIRGDLQDSDTTNALVFWMARFCWLTYWLGLDGTTTARDSLSPTYI